MDTADTTTLLIFTALRTPLIILSLILLFNLIAMTFLKKKIKVKQLAFINLFSIFTVSVSILAQTGEIVERFELSGDPFSYYLVLFSSLVFFTGIFLFTRKQKQKRKNIKEKE